ncbi:hypothetical protein U1Q18_000115 [Sarracenia purpurea var. burkii]
MASIPHNSHSDYNFCNEFCDFPSPLGPGNIGGAAAAMWVDEADFPSFIIDNGGALDNHNRMVPSHRPDAASSFSMTPFPEQFGVSDFTVPVLPEFNRGFRGIAGSQSFELAGIGYGHQDQAVCALAEDCNGFVPDFPTTVYPPYNDNYWGFQGTQVPAMEEPSLKVGKYTVEERKDRILRYLKKRHQRNFNKTIKYECRKTLADKRVRVRGRFARNNELCEGEAITKKEINNNNPHDVDDGEFYNDDTVKVLNFRQTEYLIKLF